MTVFPMLLDAPTALARLQDGSATLVDVREHAEVTREAFDAPTWCRCRCRISSAGTANCRWTAK